MAIVDRVALVRIRFNKFRLVKTCCCCCWIVVAAAVVVVISSLKLVVVVVVLVLVVVVLTEANATIGNDESDA